MRVIVTGASSGIGNGIARVLARSGATVGLVARPSPRLDMAAADIVAEGGIATVIPCDLREPEVVAAQFLDCIDSWGGIDALINNAGLVIRKSVWELTVSEWRELVETNLSGLYYATRSVLPAMRAQGSGHIINVSSISGKVPLPGGSAYAATKFGVSGFSQSLFQEVRDFGIKVTTIYPGSVASASLRHDPAADHSWKVTPDQVGDACLSLLQTPPSVCVSELEIRPLARAPKDA